MTDEDRSWTSHRLLVLALLERHDEQLKECEDNYHKQREECQERIIALKADVNTRIDSRFDASNKMVHAMIGKAKEQLTEIAKEPTEVSIAKITKRWEFWGLLVTQLATITIALIALLK